MADGDDQQLGAKDEVRSVSLRPASHDSVPSGLGAPRPRGVVRGAARWLVITKHTVLSWVRSPLWWVKAALVVVQAVALAYPVYKLGVGHFVLTGTLLLCGQLYKRWSDSRPADMKLIERNYLDRKIKFYNLIHELQQRHTMTPPQVAEYRRACLELIASYVRDYRRDKRNTIIFACLLVEEGPDLVVVERDRDHRHGKARYPKESMLAWRAMLDGEAVVTGDLYADYPDTPIGKKYCSILAVPIYSTAGEIVGAVSVDSLSRYHFDLDASELSQYLMPYLALLAWTLLPTARKALLFPPGTL